MNFKKVISITLALIFALSSLCAVSAADPWDGMTETNALKKTVTSSEFGLDENGKFNGYIQTNQEADFLSSSYIKVTYTISGAIENDTNIFTIQPFNSSWGGWQDNFVGPANSTKSGDTYTAYIAVSDVRASLSEGSLYGINISFLEPSGYTATLTGYSYLAPVTEEMTVRKWLKKSIDYSHALDESKYQPASYASFQSAITTAENVYNNSSAKDSTLQSARDTLEKAKAKLLFADSTKVANPLEFRTLSGADTVYEMGVGFNLGNTLDGHSGFHPGETSWQQFVTTKEMIRALHDAGFNTIRIPVTWGDMINDENGYDINDAWISRVQDIVDYCVEQDMYAIINIHHDGAEQDGWLRVASDDIDAVYEKYECVWRNIAMRFRDYDEHLIFESANELTCMEGDNKNSNEAQAKDTPIIMNLNQIFVNVVRSTGSNNTKRWLACVSHYANRGTGNSFALPTDSYNSSNRLMFAQHIYKDTSRDTYSWSTSDSAKSIGSVKATTDVVKASRNYKNFKDVPIILGEYGTRNRKYSGNPSGYNDIGRAYYYECVSRASQVGMTVPCVWDDSRGAGNDVYETGVYTIWNREADAPVFKTITDGMMRGMFLSPSSKNKSYDMSDIASNPKVTEITSITPSADSVTLKYGESVTVTAAAAPSGANDVVLWSSDDDTIATVYRGAIRGRRVGTTYVTAFSQSGSAQAKIKVTVLPSGANASAQVTTDKDSFRIAKGSYEFIGASASDGSAVTFSTSNEEVASVSRLGKIVAKSEGTAYITAASANGATKTVPVIVTASAGSNAVNIAAHVYYNGLNKYFGTELSAPLKISEDGQYTVTFDVSKDLSDAGKKAGVEYLGNIGSLYFKDYDVTMSNSTKSPLDSCEIRYDEIKVDGTPLTITNSSFKSAMKGGILDTGDPINAWDGCAVSEVTVDKKNYTVNFSTVKNPTKIEITFTIRNLMFTQSAETTPAVSLSAASSTNISVSEGDTVKIKTAVAPQSTTSLVSVVSSNESVVITNKNGIAPSGGECEFEILAVGKGTATVTAMTDNGLSVVFNVKVTNSVFENAAPVIENGTLTGVFADVSGEVPDSFLIIAAVFDGRKLSDAQTKTASTADIENGRLNVRGFTLPADGKIARVFIWNSADGLTPLSVQ